MDIRVFEQIKGLQFTTELMKYCSDRNIIMLIGSFQDQSEQLNRYIESIEKDQYILGLNVDANFNYQNKGANVKSTEIKGYISLGRKLFDANEFIENVSTGDVLEHQSNISEPFLNKFLTRFTNDCNHLVWILQELQVSGCSTGFKFDILEMNTTFETNKFDDCIDFVLMSFTILVES